MTHMQLSLLCISAVIIYAPASTVHSIRAPKGPCTRASTPMGHTENAVEQRLRKRVEALGGLCLKFTSSRSGVPDRIVILQGPTIFVQVKTPNKLPPNPPKKRTPHNPPTPARPARPRRALPPQGPNPLRGLKPPERVPQNPEKGAPPQDARSRCRRAS